jgi:dihydroorotase-like cyclic amidohydrolase
MWEVMPGYPFVGIHLPVLLSEGVNKRNVSLLRMTELCTKNPTEIFGLYPQKGTIAPRSDGDLVIVDLKQEKTVRHEELSSYVDWYPLEGKKLKGWPIMTIKGGVVVVDENEILGKAGQGRFIPRTTQTSRVPVLYP